MMVETAKTWLRENSTLVYFLIAQLIGIGAAVLSMTAYMTRLEARVGTLEIRGSPHLAEINNRLTTTEKRDGRQPGTLDRMVGVMTTELRLVRWRQDDQQSHNMALLRVVILLALWLIVNVEAHAATCVDIDTRERLRVADRSSRRGVQGSNQAFVRGLDAGSPTGSRNGRRVEWPRQSMPMCSPATAR